MICPCLKELPGPGNGKIGWPWTHESERLPERMPDDLPWPTLTIVTPSYNQGRFIEETIRSVLLQGYHDLEYIIIDGGSTDNSIEIIKKYEKWLTYWESRPDRGQCHAINKGWAKAKPGIWAWLNSDDTYFPDTLGKAIQTLKSQEEKLVYANVSHTDENSCHLYYYYGRPLPPGIQRMKFWKSWNIPQPTTFFYSELVEKYGGLDENFHLALDYELFIRFSKYVKFKYVNDTWATTRIHEQAKTGDWKTNKSRFFKETRAVNKKNSKPFTYYNLTWQELWNNIKEAILKNRFIQKLMGNPANIPAYQWGKILQFGKYSNAECYKQNGWHPSEIYGTWTNSNKACLTIPLQRIKANAVTLQVNLKAFLCPGKLQYQQVKVIVNDHGICNWKVDDHQYHQQTAVIPRQFLKKNRAKIEFLLPDAISPSEVGIDNDQRILGINIRSIELMPLTPNNPANHENQKARENQKAWEMKKIIFIREVFDWMGTHSAYDPLCHYIDADEHYCSFSIYRKLKPLPSSWQTSCYSFLHARINPSPFYNINSLQTEVSALKESRKKRSDILHVMYGENNYAVLGKFKKLMPGKLVVTFHQTPEWWEENYRKKHWLSLIDAIIVVSKSQADYFEQFLPGRVTWVPLGIDTTFFNPGLEPGARKKDNPENSRIVFSGHWMRDIKTLSEVVKNLVNHNPAIKFDFLVPISRRQDRYFKELEKFPQVCWHSGLTDEQLRAIYREASLLFIPYLNCTASCALLEAMACGLPIVSSRVGGIPEYTHPSFAELLPIGDIDGFTQTIINLTQNHDKLCEKSILTRKYVEEQFAWDKIAQKTIAVYKQIEGR